MPKDEAPFVYFIGGDQPSNQPPQPNPVASKIKDITINNNVDAQTRNMIAIARQNEARIFLDGLAEIRHALSLYSIGEDDAGTSERPPITPAFFEAERGMLQTRYLKHLDRYSKFIDHVLKKEILK